MSYVRNERFQGNLDNSLDNIENNIINLKNIPITCNIKFSLGLRLLLVLVNKQKSWFIQCLKDTKI